MDTLSVQIVQMAFDSGVKLGSVVLLGTVVLTVMVVVGKSLNRSV